MNIDRIESLLVQHLKPALPKNDVQAFPADVRVFLESFRSVSGAVLVQFVERKFRRMSPDRAHTQVTFTFEVAFVGKNLKQHDGIYDMMTAVFQALHNVVFDMPDAGVSGLRLFCTGDGYEAYYEKSGLWVYTQQYESEPIPYIQPQPPTGEIIRIILISNTETVATVDIETE